MKYEELEDTIKSILSNDEIIKNNLIMVYQLESEKHKKLEEYIFFKNNPQAKKKDFEPKDDFEIDVEDFTILFIKKDADDSDIDLSKKIGNKKNRKSSWISKFKSLF